MLDLVEEGILIVAFDENQRHLTAEYANKSFRSLLQTNEDITFPCMIGSLMQDIELFRKLFENCVQLHRVGQIFHSLIRI